VKLVDHSAYVGEPQRVSVWAELREAAVRKRAKNGSESGSNPTLSVHHCTEWKEWGNECEACHHCTWQDRMNGAKGKGVNIHEQKVLLAGAEERNIVLPRLELSVVLPVFRLCSGR
jgi:hypothetical protein